VGAHISGGSPDVAPAATRERRVVAIRDFTKGTNMSHAISSNVAAGGLLALAIAVGGAASVAGAFPDPGEPGAPPPGATSLSISTHSHGDPRLEPLERLGTQFVRGDDLTGAGVPAPPWVPVLSW
jgi:hypothetical protein